LIIILNFLKLNKLGYSKTGNGGSGLGEKFANGLTESFRKYLTNFGQEKGISPHLEKICLFDTGIGKDNISDFTTNLIVGYLANYTQKFSNKNIDDKFLEDFKIEKYKFNYNTSSWVPKVFKLPFIIKSNGKKEYVLLTPKDILTKDNPWINNKDKLNQFNTILEILPNEQLRSQINRYFNSILKKDEKGRSSKKDQNQAKLQIYQEYPELIDLFIKTKEESGDQAIANSSEIVAQTESIFIDLAREMLKNYNLKQISINKKQILSKIFTGGCFILKIGLKIKEVGSYFIINTEKLRMNLNSSYFLN
jgi:hypothetical protein